MKKGLAVVLKLTILIAFFSFVLASAESYYDSSYETRQYINTGPTEGIDYGQIKVYSNCNLCNSPYYKKYEEPKIYHPKYYDKYSDYYDKYYCKPKFTDYQIRSYGHGLQLVRFRVDNYYEDYPHYKYYSENYGRNYRNACFDN